VPRLHCTIFSGISYQYSDQNTEARYLHKVKHALAFWQMRTVKQELVIHDTDWGVHSRIPAIAIWTNKHSTKQAGIVLVSWTHVGKRENGGVIVPFMRIRDTPLNREALFLASILQILRRRYGIEASACILTISERRIYRNWLPKWASTLDSAILKKIICAAKKGS